MLRRLKDQARQAGDELSGIESCQDFYTINVLTVRGWISQLCHWVSIVSWTPVSSTENFLEARSDWLASSCSDSRRP